MDKIKALFYRYQELIKYIFFGVLTTIVSLGSYYLLVITIFNPNDPLELQIANIFSWIAAVLFAFVTNRRYVFESKNINWKFEMFKFFSSRFSTLLMDMLIMFLGVTVLSFNDKAVKLFVQIVVLLANYILSKFLVFRKK